MNDFKNKRVIVTGAASGIGKAVAEQFLAQGALVGLIDRNEEELQEFLADYDAQAHYLERLTSPKRISCKKQ